MQHWIRDQNIKLFKAALSGVLPPETRATIEALLAKEQANSEAEESPSATPASGALVIKPARQHGIREGFPPAPVPGDTKS